VLPYLDITLTAATSSAGIIIAMAFSLLILKERFIVKYDLPGMLFIIAGCSTIVINANKIDETFTKEECIELLTSPPCLTYTAIVLTLNRLNSWYVKKFLSRLRQFESDVEAYD